MKVGLVDGWSLVRFLHVLGAIVWVGGQLTLFLVVTPVLRRALVGPELAAPMRGIGRRFALVANAAVLPLLLVTGLALAWHRGVDLGTFGVAGYGRTLGLKLVLVAVALAAAAGHGVGAAHRSGRLQRALMYLSLAASLVVVLLATSLVP